MYIKVKYKLFWGYLLLGKLGNGWIYSSMCVYMCDFFLDLNVICYFIKVVEILIKTILSKNDNWRFCLRRVLIQYDMFRSQGFLGEVGKLFDYFFKYDLLLFLIFGSLGWILIVEILLEFLIECGFQLVEGYFDFLEGIVVFQNFVNDIFDLCVCLGCYSVLVCRMFVKLGVGEGVVRKRSEREEEGVSEREEN